MTPRNRHALTKSHAELQRGHRPENSDCNTGLHADYRRAHLQREYVLELSEIDDVPAPTAWRLSPLPKSDDVMAEAQISGGDRMVAVKCGAG